jgi:hypothetical protein
MNAVGATYVSPDTTPKMGKSTVIFPGSTQPNRAIRSVQPLTVQPLSASTQPRKAFRPSHVQNLVGSSTELYELSDALYSKIETIFWTAKGEVFEDGMESAFSQQLISFVKRYGNNVLESITCLIVYESVDPEVSGEALRWLGRIEHAESYKYRCWLLERSLSLSSTRVRDGAILGLASMDDKHAIPYLKLAIGKEQCFELKADMELVLEQLES